MFQETTKKMKKREALNLQRPHQNPERINEFACLTDTFILEFTTSTFHKTAHS